MGGRRLRPPIRHLGKDAGIGEEWGVRCWGVGARASDRPRCLECFLSVVGGMESKRGRKGTFDGGGTAVDAEDEGDD